MAALLLSAMDLNVLEIGMKVPSGMWRCASWLSKPGDSLDLAFLGLLFGFASLFAVRGDGICEALMGGDGVCEALIIMAGEAPLSSSPS